MCSSNFASLNYGGGIVATYCFDIDGTICTNTLGKYKNAKPYKDMLRRVNNLYNNGHKIIFMTARGSVSNVDYTDFTENQLKEWGFRYHELIMNKKPHADLFIDDRAQNAIEWRTEGKKVGIVTSYFDLIHPGYVTMLREAKTVCEHLICALHEDPSVERETKTSPVHSVEERIMILESIKYVDEIVTYKTEDELHRLLQTLKPDIRIIGTDWKNKNFTGDDLDIEIHWHQRNHNWSTSNLKEKIKNA